MTYRKEYLTIMKNSCGIDKKQEGNKKRTRNTGIIRKVDELGRIVLPIELRRTLDISERDELEIYLEDDKVIMRKYEPSCVFCGKTKGLITYHARSVCKECINNMNQV